MLVRCEDHLSKAYSCSVDPVGYPDAAAVCGRCEKPGKILLNDSEWQAYKAGKTVFAFNNNVMRVKAKPATRI